MGYWTSYIGVGFYGATRPLFTEAGTLLFNPLVVGASLLLPGARDRGFVWTRRWRYAPFFLLLLLVGVAIEVAGFPNGTPAARRWSGSTATCRWCASCAPRRRPRRSSRSGSAGLLGAGRAAAWARLRALRAGLRRARWSPAAVPGGADRCSPRCRSCAARRSRSSSPGSASRAAWTDAGQRPRPRAAAQLARAGPARADLRQLHLGRDDRRDPAARDRSARSRCATRPPTATRTPPTCSGRSTGSSSSAACCRASCRPLLRLIGAGAVVTGSDDDISRSGGGQRRRGGRRAGRPGPRRARAQLRARARGEPPARGELDGPARAARRCAATTSAAGRGLVHVDAAGPAHDRRRRRRGAGGPGRLRRAAGARADPLRRRPRRGRAAPRRPARGAEVVITDSNRRRRVVPEFAPPEPRRHAGRGREPLDPELRDRSSRSPTAAPTPRRSPCCRARATCARPSAGGLLEFPEHDAIEAFDGDPRHGLGRRPLPATRASAGSRSASSSRATCPTSTCCPLRDWSGQVDRGRRQRRPRQGSARAAPRPGRT